jgi:hypothetical protein
MGAQAIRIDPQQLGLYGKETPAGAPGATRRSRLDPRPRVDPPLCAGCREREARYGFRHQDDPAAERPRTLCFECFRVEVGRRQAIAARMARGWNAQQVTLPLEHTLDALARRRRRAQIAARHALAESGDY